MRCPEPMTHFSLNPQRGVTLIELVMVIVVTGIIAAGVAVFIQRPVEGYIDAGRRATLTNEARLLP